MQENYPTLIAQKTLNGDFRRFSKIMITSDEFTIGRSLGHSVVIPYLAISRKHCTFMKINDGWAIEDSSSFGIQVNNKKLKKGSVSKLSHNDIIQLDATGDFIYKFKVPDDSGCTPRKRIKLEKDLDIPDGEVPSDIIHNVQLKFEESQSFEIRNIEERIQTAKQMQTTSKILKQQLELDMSRKIQKLQDDFALQIENLKGEKNEVERQKAVLEDERDVQLASVKGEMETKITELMDRIHKHNETETELLNENSSLKEKLLKEREDFLAELHRENSSKQDLMRQLEMKIKEQEEIRLKEKQELEKMLRTETENLKMAKEKELKELEDQTKLREQELQKELEEIRSQLKEQVSQTEMEKLRLQQELKEKSEQMIKLSEEEKNKIEKLMQDRAEAEKRLIEAEATSEKTEKELSARVSAREMELAALASARIQQQAEQSTEVIISLQEQLENVRSQLQFVETEKNTLLESICHATGEGSSSKQATLTEVGELMESELQCSICAELFVAATTLSCSHTFCTYCITVWTKKKRECPICRAPITTQSKSLVLDSFIEKMVANLTDEMKNKRLAMLRDREELDAELKRSELQSAGPSRRSDLDDDFYYSESEDELDEEAAPEEGEGEDYDEYGYEDYDHRRYSWASYSGSDAPSSEDIARASSAARDLSVGREPSLSGHSSDSSDSNSDSDSGSSRRRRRRHVEGLPGVYYGGYGRCFRCGARGHWAPGCPNR